MDSFPRYAALSPLPLTKQISHNAQYQKFYNTLANLTGYISSSRSLDALNIYITFQPSCLTLNSFACLVALDADTLGEANYLVLTGGFYGTAAFSPVIDGKFIVERPTLTLARGRVNGVNHLFCRKSNRGKLTYCTGVQEVLLAVTNPLEGETFVLPNFTESIPAYTQAYFPLLNAVHADQVAEIYALGESLPTAQDQAVAIVGECECTFMVMTYSIRNSS